MKVLITGGPVYGKLDDVKLITNRFKGGLMADLADRLCVYPNIDITYLTTKDSKHPLLGKNTTVIYHDGFESYKNKVLELAPKMNAVILGAAIANLIPCETIKGKFPSHQYKEGDIIPINFKIAPRIINMVKQVAPYTKLFGFKLLSGAKKTELIEAANEIVLSSKAVTVFANDTSDLLTKYAITKEHSIIEMNIEQMVDYLYKCINDEYYKTIKAGDYYFNDITSYADKYYHYCKNYSSAFSICGEYMFGCVAVRINSISLSQEYNPFIISPRGKNNITDKKYCVINHVNHSTLEIESGDKLKASLNAPLIYEIFRQNKEVSVVVHLHEYIDDLEKSLPKYEYAIPGTKRDSLRYINSSFNIEYHGYYLIFDSNGNMI